MKLKSVTNSYLALYLIIATVLRAAHVSYPYSSTVLCWYSQFVYNKIVVN